MANKKELTEEEKDKFKIIKILDEWRWQDFPTDFEYNFGNYCDSLKEKIGKCFYNDDKKGKFEVGIVNDEKIKLAEKILLTHYLIYICNRLRDARSIFRDGLPVISQIVEDYYDKNINKKDFKNFINSHVKTEEKAGKYKHKLIVEGKEPFASKNTAQDYYCIFRTLETLKKGKNDFSEYLNKKDINDLANSLYRLTYQGVTNLASNEKDFIDVYVDFKNVAEGRSEDLMNRHGQKRLWCVIRDYLYHPVFKELFKIVIDDDNFNNLKEQSYLLELPGDVRNNNSEFAKCFWGEENLPKNKDGDISENYNSSKFVRKQFDEDKKVCTLKNQYECWGGCYPYHFDITFELVERMCNSNNCSMCPICKEVDEDAWTKLCHNNGKSYCPFALYTTGIKHECEGEKCELLNVI